MTRIIFAGAVLLAAVTMLASPAAYASKFGGAGRVNTNGFFSSSSNTARPQQVCVPHGHHQCPNPPGSTIPDCRGSHTGPNGVAIQCK